MLNTTYTPKRALLKLLNPLKRLMDREASIKYIHYLMFFKYLSDQLEEHFTKIIENKDIILRPHRFRFEFPSPLFHAADDDSRFRRIRLCNECLNNLAIERITEKIGRAHV